ncbi:hypothetical protein [Vulcanisaeta sp. JCM 16159]|uniref:hypothetical protein n=1 Tax=Vulcanisaeta sp. JCM 16159 TaxID=1295371 RepID=UPI000AF59872|nr:hypothetical protein [Vulcanisaeta sp. JCM 16159]
MSTNVDISIEIDELYKRVLENKKRVTEYVKGLYEVYSKITGIVDLPVKSEKNTYRHT